jgi:hypothetical protein
MEYNESKTLNITLCWRVRPYLIRRAARCSKKFLCLHKRRLIISSERGKNEHAGGKYTKTSGFFQGALTGAGHKLKRRRPEEECAALFALLCRALFWRGEKILHRNWIMQIWRKRCSNKNLQQPVHFSASRQLV